MARIVDVTSKTIGVKIPQRLNQQLEDLCRRDSVTLSATVKRLLSLGIRQDARSERGPEPEAGR